MQRIFPRVIFADTNILIGVSRPGSNAIIDALSQRHFKNSTVYYTETVNAELNAISNTQLPKNFVFLPSKLDVSLKQAAYREFTTMWKISITTYTLLVNWQIKIPEALSDKHKIKFMNDIYMIFEASYSMFSRESAWQPGQLFPVLLTNNMRLYHKFLNSESKQDVLDTVINAYGMEHLIEVVPLDRVDNNGNIH